MQENNHWIEDWLSERIEKEKNKKEYLAILKTFIEYCQERGIDFLNIVADYRSAKYAGAREEQKFLDNWNDLIKRYATFLKNRINQRGGKYTPLSLKTYLSVPKSFFSCYRIPLDVRLPKRTCVFYHNRDLTKEIIRQILSKATQRNRTIWLSMSESGLRAHTMINLKYWQIKDDFEKGTVPMRILTPASQIKYHVNDRWSFVGEDGFKALKEYLEPSMPLKDDDFVFSSEKPEKVRGGQFTVASISATFRKTINALKLEKGYSPGKPGHYRMHGLRKYFFNNMIAPKEYRDFWMGHTISSSDEYYITHDPEKHRKVYAKGYEQLRILEPVTPTQLTEIADKLQQKDREIQELRAQNEKLSARLDQLAEPLKVLKEMNSVEKILEGLSEDEERTSLGLIIRYIQLKTAQELYEDVQKLKQGKETASKEE